MFDKEPDDMFAGTDVPTPAPPTGSAPRAAIVSAPAPTAAPSAMPSAESVYPSGHMSGTKLLLIIIGTVIVVGAAGYLSFTLLGSKEPVVPQEQVPAPTGGRLTPEEVNLGGTTPVVPEPTPEPVVSEPIVPAPVVVDVDTDKDGLSDVEEARLGTDPSKNDTDEDGLNDREEVVIYTSDPLKADTDGDTYPDGSEVRNGYNPAGPGKLLVVPTQAL